MARPLPVNQRRRHAWSLNEADSQPFLRQALDWDQFLRHGQRLLQWGQREVLGRFLKHNARREAVVVATRFMG